MLERITAESSNEQTDTGTLKGALEEGFSSLRAVSFLPIPEGNGSPERTMMTGKEQTLTIAETAQVLSADNATVRKFVEIGELSAVGQRIVRKSVEDFVRHEPHA